MHWERNNEELRMASRALAWATGRIDLSLTELGSSKFVEEEQELSCWRVGVEMP